MSDTMKMLEELVKLCCRDGHVTIRLGEDGGFDVMFMALWLGWRQKCVNRWTLPDAIRDALIAAKKEKA